MSLRQIHELDKIVKRKHRNLKREIKINKMKEQLYNKFQLFAESIVDTLEDITNRFIYNNKKLAYAKKK